MESSLTRGKDNEEGGAAAEGTGTGEEVGNKEGTQAGKAKEAEVQEEEVP